MPYRLFRISLLLSLAILAVCGVRTVYRNNSQAIALKPLTLDPAHPGKRRLGELIFERAWELGSDNSDFGGISALTTLPDGRFIGLSDAGTLIGFSITSNEQTEQPFIVPLPGAAGKDVGYQDRDSEGITYDRHSGHFWVSYEVRHVIRRFSLSFARVEAKSRPVLTRGWPSNSGGEALVRMADGRFVLFSEGAKRGPGLYAAILFSGDPVERGTNAGEFRYRPPAGYRVTDATMLPDGRMLLLHRKIALPYGLFAARLAIVDTATIKPGAVVSGHVIATLASPLLVDNMEGVTVTQEAGNIIIWLVSDNNFTILQRTLLMKFRLSERRPRKKPEAAPAPGFESL